MGERLLKVLGQIDFGTLDSGERSLPFGLLVVENGRLSISIGVLLHLHTNGGMSLMPLYRKLNWLGMNNIIFMKLNLIANIQ